MLAGEQYTRAASHKSESLLRQIWDRYDLWLAEQEQWEEEQGWRLTPGSPPRLGVGGLLDELGEVDMGAVQGVEWMRGL